MIGENRLQAGVGLALHPTPKVLPPVRGSQRVTYFPFTAPGANATNRYLQWTMWGAQP